MISEFGFEKVLRIMKAYKNTPSSADNKENEEWLERLKEALNIDFKKTSEV